jgi:hypothetical protein
MSVVLIGCDSITSVCGVANGTVKLGVLVMANAGRSAGIGSASVTVTCSVT